MREPMVPGDPQVGGTPEETVNHPDTHHNPMAPTTGTIQSHVMTQLNQINVINHNNHNTNPNQPNNNYYMPWGDTIQPKKTTDCLAGPTKFWQMATME